MNVNKVCKVCSPFSFLNVLEAEAFQHHESSNDETFCNESALHTHTILEHLWLSWFTSSGLTSIIWTLPFYKILSSYIEIWSSLSTFIFN